LLGLLAILYPASANAQVGYPRTPYPYGYRYAEPESNLRLAVTPREAAVYVDGYYAGTVDEFDGMLQRLHVTPGEHEIVFYLPGYRLVRQKLYLSANANRKITETMEKLGAGEPEEAPPTPRDPSPSDRLPPQSRDPFPGRGRIPPPRGTRPETPPLQTPQRQGSSVGSLVIRVQPTDADVLIDGEHWRGPSSDERLVVQVAQGHHRIEVHKDGYATFTTEVDVKGDDSLPVNVSLARER
jgi:hypothetical protein